MENVTRRESRNRNCLLNYPPPLHARRPDDPLVGVCTLIEYDQDCSPRSDWSPCAKPRQRSPALWRGYSSGDLLPPVLPSPPPPRPAGLPPLPALPDFPSGVPRGPALVAAGPLVTLPRGPGDPTPVAVPAFHVGAGMLGESCDEYCLRAHHPASRFDAAALLVANTCEDLTHYIGSWCTKSCRAYSLPGYGLPGLCDTRCAPELVPRRFNGALKDNLCQRLCACAVSADTAAA